MRVPTLRIGEGWAPWPWDTIEYFRVTLAVRREGSWIGESSLLKNDERKYDVMAVCDAHIAMLHWTTCMCLFENSAGFAHLLVQQLNERTRDLMATIECDRMHCPHHLARLVNPLLYPNASGCIQISQEGLALLAGVSPQTASGGPLLFEGKGLITNERGSIRILDLEKLARFEG